MTRRLLAWLGRLYPSASPTTPSRVSTRNTTPIPVPASGALYKADLTLSWDFTYMAMDAADSHRLDLQEGNSYRVYAASDTPEAAKEALSETLCTFLGIRLRASRQL